MRATVRFQENDRRQRLRFEETQTLKGDDGFSPTVAVTEIAGGHRVTITDAQGDHPFDVMNGEAISCYVHTQSQAAAEWTITHNLGIYPSVTVIDSSNDVCVGDIKYLDSNTVKASFQAPFSGKAYLN